MAEVIHKGGNKYRVRIFCRRDDCGKKIYCVDKTLVLSKEEAKVLADNYQRRHDAGTLHEGQEVKLHPLDGLADELLARKRKHSESNVGVDHAEMVEQPVRKLLATNAPKNNTSSNGGADKGGGGRPPARSENEKLLAAVNGIAYEWHQENPGDRLPSTELVERLQAKGIFYVDNTLRRKIKRLTGKNYDEYVESARNFSRGKV